MPENIRVVDNSVMHHKKLEPGILPGFYFQPELVLICVTGDDLYAVQLTPDECLAMGQGMINAAVVAVQGRKAEDRKSTLRAVTPDSEDAPDSAA